ncbi:hypothetical protein A2631_00080 [Candidatus Daviesbacteria bacterium RIFCSPHIGHO2_01_FULL_44_29]|uniref:Non-canonical purine NTP pyrophosphatase n=1 Tax=Candidatus Daviesbacteria bacterium RIFCSPHIGHO2_02_FULL_43_12 TaxID=1797776 RepID=A0A1F5KHZ4_9BACT|nr:MAG: hypothetical protein A2631_00080 [Candidatus Daviesbacteria bacterium RIFCSPHIGHO2_01_FULL_44_29]OGE40567.1 MAG: hypothetical protein A3D25_00415 [Candidatus Daviesbacteria bacterium RIFCSPHIGHO2_02_FULL_43_12]OGE40915.1 MAG: hypothetical protein A3E86_05505 [Candidatus Daviesbacteria bacterium RIFCSPHIGHO2_12_FULL_47_45]OGE70127.1 MAG: hypothetical protein A3B55_00185 [Candidatus Daviesbacteria bacterium RIFCSPLOWO2_01_FULL_43_15]
MEVYLITGNKNKVAEFERVLGGKVNHVALDLDELQGMDGDVISEHKVKQAYAQIKKPVIVVDQKLEIACLNGFPGPLIKWFWETIGLEKICRIVDCFDDRSVIARNTLTYYNGQELKHFYAEAKGQVDDHPKGHTGFGWDPIFIPEGETKTYAELGVKNPHYHETYTVVIEEFKKFLETKDYSLLVDD